MAIAEGAAHWSVSTAPIPRQDARFNEASLQPAVETASVSLRGWSFPHIPRQAADLTLQASQLEGRTDWAQYKEIWRFHTDGLFTFRWRMREDGTSFAGTIHVIAAIYTIAEIWEFARRLYGREDDVTHVSVDIRLNNVRDRQLAGDSWHDLPYGARARANDFQDKTVIATPDLLADAAIPAQGTTQRLFQHLGFAGISDQFIAETTTSFLRRGAT